MVGKFKSSIQNWMVLLIILISFGIPYFSAIRDIPIHDSQDIIDNLRVSLYNEWNITLVNYHMSVGVDIALDSENDIYGFGNFYNDSKGGYDRLLLKYDKHGSLQWNRTFTYDLTGLNLLEVDSDNSLIIVGAHAGDLLILKYNNWGDLIWEESWATLGVDEGRAVCVDGLNNIYIVGYSDGSDALGDVVILKYNSTGDLKWNTTWGGTDTDNGYDIGVDYEDNIYIMGHTSSFGAVTADIFLAKFNNSGILQWNKTWGGISPDTGTALAIDPLNNIYLTGFSSVGLTHDLFVLKINSGGTLQWNYTYSSSGYDFGYDLTLDSQGNIYVTGITNQDIVLIKLNPSKVVKWVRKMGSSLMDAAYGITIDDDDNLFIIGYQQQENLDEYLRILKFTTLPGMFELNSNAESPDPDGTFTLEWTASIDADNYSLFQSDYPIADINGSVIELVSGFTNQTFAFTNISQGTYFYMVMAHNQDGTTNSNCLKIRIQNPPQDFSLYEHPVIPDTDGNINLSWTQSVGASNYSIFVGTSEIFNVELDGTLIADNITDTYFAIEGQTNGDYYYVVGAYNEAGELTSNCIHVVVRRAPTPFILTSDASTPQDSDGSFELIWEHSEYALRYEVYISNYSIIALNSSVVKIHNFTIQFHWPLYRYNLSGLINGTYYFIVAAFNDFGEYISGCLEVIVEIIPENKPEIHLEVGIGNIIAQVVSYTALGGLLFGMVLIYNKRKKR